MPKANWPIIHLYGPYSPHDEQIIACNDAGLAALKQLVNGDDNHVEVFTDDGEGYFLCLLVTEETNKLPSPYTDDKIQYGPSDWTCLIEKIRGILGISPKITP